MRQRDHWDLVDLLLDKAARDQATVHELLHNPGVADEIVAFHAQQAAEKMLKAVLVSLEASYRKTHDLLELIDLLAESDISVPETSAIKELTPFAVEYRYENLPLDEEESFDRESALALLQRLRQWTEEVLNQKRPSDRSGPDS